MWILEVSYYASSICVCRFQLQYISSKSVCFSTSAALLKFSRFIPIYILKVVHISFAVSYHIFFLKHGENALFFLYVDFVMIYSMMQIKIQNTLSQKHFTVICLQNETRILNLALSNFQICSNECIFNECLICICKHSLSENNCLILWLISWGKYEIY